MFKFVTCMYIIKNITLILELLGCGIANRYLVADLLLQAVLELQFPSDHVTVHTSPLVTSKHVLNCTIFFSKLICLRKMRLIWLAIARRTQEHWLSRGGKVSQTLRLHSISRWNSLNGIYHKWISISTWKMAHLNLQKVCHPCTVILLDSRPSHIRTWWGDEPFCSAMPKKKRIAIVLVRVMTFTC